jgi:hypothetical protein
MLKVSIELIRLLISYTYSTSFYQTHLLAVSLGRRLKWMHQIRAMPLLLL